MFNSTHHRQRFQNNFEILPSESTLVIAALSSIAQDIRHLRFWNYHIISSFSVPISGSVRNQYGHGVNRYVGIWAEHWMFGHVVSGSELALVDRFSQEWKWHHCESMQTHHSS